MRAIEHDTEPVECRVERWRVQSRCRTEGKCWKFFEVLAPALFPFPDLLPLITSSYRVQAGLESPSFFLIFPLSSSLITLISDSSLPTFFMIPAKMSAARAASLRSQAPTLRASSQRLSTRAAQYSSVSAQKLAFSNSNRAVLQSPSTSAFKAVSPFAALPLTRSFHVATSLWQQQQQQKQQEEKKEEEPKSDSQGEESKEEGKEKKEEKAPPPPHGDKSPWQVFRETLQTEFKASKEWEESTKALASSAHQFSENENVRRARAAYEAASTATTSRTSTAFKTTGQVIGKGAAWTWNTGVVKGVRKGVNATGEGLEKATRPVRETEAYKSVKDAIDDGSSSRYGGWVEKEERRQARERREELDRKAGKTHFVEERVENPE